MLLVSDHVKESMAIVAVHVWVVAALLITTAPKSWTSPIAFEVGGPVDTNL